MEHSLLLPNRELVKIFIRLPLAFYLPTTNAEILQTESDKFMDLLLLSPTADYSRSDTKLLASGLPPSQEWQNAELERLEHSTTAMPLCSLPGVCRSPTQALHQLDLLGAMSIRQQFMLTLTLAILLTCQS